MLNNKLQLLSLIVLPIVSTSTYANISSDLISIDNLGIGACSEGYHPLDRLEAKENKNALLKLMGRWQITGLKDGWSIMGSGYHGEIKKQQSNSTFCYPDDPKTGLIDFPPHAVPEGSEAAVNYNLVKDQGKFISPLSKLAHNLGYVAVSGNNSPYPGEDMEVSPYEDGWVILGNRNGSCTGYRCNDKTQIFVNNFAYTLDDGSFQHGAVVESDRELVKTITATARNHSSIQQQVVVNLNVGESTNWSKTNSYGFSQKVTTENAFNWPLVGSTKVSIAFKADQSFASTDGAATSEQVTLGANVNLPPHSEVPIRIELYRSSISYPYQFNANISYDVAFVGYLRGGNNAWHTHPSKDQFFWRTFTIGRAGDKSSNIRYQWDNRHIPSEVKWWNWEWAIDSVGMEQMRKATSMSLRPFHSYVTGDFYAESQYAGTIEVGDETPIGQSRSILNELNEAQRYGDVTIISDLDKEELRGLGFGEAKFEIRVAN
ncbi:aerolysin family beta-barrel pore-forming toxin [Aliivibrio salmonicida]|uniref:aerolysin family beta-barrel pore-forming toxin n=1 Tax=Aliivibrio salmonicida TaxID=40269 RepID=UPI00406C99E2